MSAALDLLRRRRTRRTDMLAPIDHHEEDPRAAAPSADVAVEASELEEQVARAVETIPASRRPVVRMYLAGYHREEIAGLLGWTEAKTRNLLYRGLADLRERLNELGISAEGAQ
jgi:RNA polymerase sigma-70 factor (ECF subfamily)